MICMNPMIQGCDRAMETVRIRPVCLSKQCLLAILVLLVLQVLLATSGPVGRRRHKSPLAKNSSAGAVLGAANHITRNISEETKFVAAKPREPAAVAVQKNISKLYRDLERDSAEKNAAEGSISKNNSNFVNNLAPEIVPKNVFEGTVFVTENNKHHDDRRLRGRLGAVIDKADDMVKPDVAAEKVPGMELPDRHKNDEEKVGHLPVGMVLPGITEPHQNPDTGNPDSKEPVRQDMEKGLVVGVGGINRKNPLTTPSKVFPRGPEDLLDVGAADRKGLPDKHLENAGAVGRDDQNLENSESPPNPAMEQPVPQAREPPVAQFQDGQLAVKNAPDGFKKSVEMHQDPQLQEPPVLKEPQSNKLAKGDGNKASEDEGSLRFQHKTTKLQLDEKVPFTTLKLEVNPPDHVEGMRMEHDGHINHDYKKEIFLGHHEEFDFSDEEKVSGKLKVMFRRVDVNSNDLLESDEIQKWIILNVKVHLDDAMRDNAKVFRHLDANKDGFVSWLEFYSHFLVAKGYVRSASLVQLNSSISLELDDDERILKYKYRWEEADDGRKDGQLDSYEMMNFRHPEQSKVMIEKLVKEMIDNIDKNGDGLIEESEFAALPHDLEDAEPLPSEEDWQEERRKEFRNVIDRNKDGKVDSEELKVYFDPKNVNHARLEADNLIKMADADNNGKLSLEEVLDNMELFVGSKMVDAKRKLHDEF